MGLPVASSVSWEDFLAAHLQNGWAFLAFGVAALAVMSAAVVIPFLALVRWEMRRWRRKISGVLADLGVDASTISFGPRSMNAPLGSCRFRSRDRIFSVVRRPDGRYHQGRWLLSLRLEREFSFELIRNTPTDRLFGKSGFGSLLGLSGSPVTTGDASFDSDFILSSEEPGQAASFFGDEERRRRARELFALGAEGVEFSSGELVFTRLEDFDADLGALIESMIGLATGLPDAPPEATFASEQRT